MNTIDDFIALVQDELGLLVSTEDAERNLDQLSGWDSVYLLALLNALERTTGRSISLPDVLEASTLEEIYALAVAA